MIIDNETNKRYSTLTDYINSAIPNIHPIFRDDYVKFKFENRSLSYIPDELAPKVYETIRKRYRYIEFR